MMSTCRKYQQIMHRVLDREASDGERAAVDRHMTVCPTCADFFRSLEFSLDLLAAMPTPTPAPDFTARTVERALSAEKVRDRRGKYVSWCLGILMVLMSISLTAGWSAVMQPVAWLGLRGLLNVLSKGMVLCSVFDKLQTILAGLLSLMGDIAIKVVLGEGGPVFWGCLVVVLLSGFMFARSGIRMSGVSIKRR
jgi:hypothetical protein